MIITNPVRRRVARDLARLGALLCAFMLGLTTWIAVDGGDAPVYAVTGGTAGVFSAGGGGSSPLTSGGSATHFVVRPPDGSKCTGDSAQGGYKVNTYMVPASVDPSTLLFNNNGPVPPSGSTFAQPLYNATGLGKITNLQTGPGDGLIIGIPPMTFEIYSAASPAPDGFFSLPMGTYNVGVVCALTTSQPYTLDKFWNVQITFAADGADTPGGFTWTVEAGGGATTTTTTAPGETTTTTAPGETTTTALGATTTTSTPGGGGGVTTTDPGGPVVLGNSASGGPSGTGLLSELPRTGSSPATFVVWSVLLLVFGRMAILLGRTPRVIPQGA